MRIPCTLTALFLLALLALLAGQACAEIEKPQAGQTPISFSAVVSGDMPATKAEGMIGDEAALQAAGFGVFACYTGLHKYSESNVTADFMYNQPVTWSSQNSHWVYDPVKYWPNGEGEASNTGTGENPHYVSFFAYAPYSDGSNECIPSFSLYREQTDPWVMYRLAEDVANQVDLLYAAPLLDQTKPAVNEKMTFQFKHALACVGEKVTLDCSSSLIDRQKSDVDDGTIDEVEYILKSLRINYILTEKGRLILWNKGMANWMPIISEDVLTTRTLTLFNGTTLFLHYKQGDTAVSVGWNDQGHGIFCIPVEASGYPQKAVVEMDYLIRRKKGVDIFESDRSVSTELLLNGRIQEGKTLDISITLTN